MAHQSYEGGGGAIVNPDDMIYDMTGLMDERTTVMMAMMMMRGVKQRTLGR